MKQTTKYALDNKRGISHIVLGEPLMPEDYSVCGVNVLNMSLSPVPPVELVPCAECLHARASMAGQHFLPSQPPAAIERLQSTEEMLMMTLFKSWANRIDREIEILKAQMVDASKLEGLSTLRDELGQASDSMSNAWMISKFGNINNP